MLRTGVHRVHDDDAIRALFQRADPARTPVDAPLTAEQVAIRDRITRRVTAAAPPRRRRTWRWAAAIALPAAATIAIAIVVAGSLTTATPAAAFGPRALIVEATNESTVEALARLIVTSQSSGPATDQEGATFHEWALAISDIGTPQESTVVQASVVELTWNGDGSGQRRFVAGDPFYADGSSGIPTDIAHKPGDPLSSQNYKPGEFSPSLPDLTTLDLPSADALVPFGLTLDSSAGDLALLLPAVLNEWQPSAAHEARLLELLGSLSGLSLDGATTDRLDRPALAFTATSPQHRHREWTVLISPETGRFLGLEERTVGTDPDLAVPPGTVTQYIAWP